MGVVSSVWIGFDPREATGFAVARYTIRQYDKHIPIFGLVLDNLRKLGLYTRPTEERINSDGKRQLWDVISDAPMATEFSISRFLVPALARSWALFVDSDVMFRRNINRIFGHKDSSKAVVCVKHDYQPADGVKMDGQLQTSYSRKNWSSVMLFNCDHPSNKKLTVELVNTATGRDLHRFCWLEDHEIGELPETCNYLVGHTQIMQDPDVVHFTAGLPDVPGYEKQEYADDWRQLVPYAVGAL